VGEITASRFAEVAGSATLPKDLDARVYAELMRLARSQLARAGTMSLDAPSLVHEAYLRFQAQGAIASAQRNIFFAYSAQVMRTVIVDYVRERHAQKRGGGEPMLTLTTGIPGISVGEDGASARGAAGVAEDRSALASGRRTALFRRIDRTGNRRCSRGLGANREA
jgi:DNA-directed RNA polymerase specialized sigma24 family protein